MAAQRTRADGSTRRSKATIAWAAVSAAFLFVLMPTGRVWAEDAAAPQADDASPLASEERQVLDRFSDLEKKLLRMAELSAATDPHRASLLRKAVAQSKQQGIESQLAKLVELLGQERLAPAVKNQAAVEQDLTRLLELLLSEDRSKRLQSEKERIGKYIQRVNQLIKQQKQLQGETAGEADLARIAEQQGKLAEKTEELARDIGDSEGESKAKGKSGSKDKPAAGDADDQSGDGKSGKNKPKPGKSSKPGKPGDDKPADDQPADTDEPEAQPADDEAVEGEPADETENPNQPDSKKKPLRNKPANGKESPEGKGSSDGKPADDPSTPGDSDSQEKPAESGKPGEGKPGGSPPGGSSEPPQPSEPEAADEGEKNPVRERVAQAEQKMRDAQQKLAEALRDKGVQKQEEAKRALELAKAELEAILRQLREEEIGRTLAMLESRFRKMLDLQNQVNTGTRRLDKVPVAERDHDDEIEAGRLSRQEAAIVGEADKALAVLHDEGSAVAFPEAVGDLRDDMEQVVVRLAQAKVDTLTQGLEDDIVVALEEMIAALHAAQKEQAQQVKPKGAQSDGETEAPLVDDLSEIKMIRSMQMWVNQRTKRYTEMVKTDTSETPDLIAALRRLADREERIRRVTRDIVVGRNK